MRLTPVRIQLREHPALTARVVEEAVPSSCLVSQPPGVVVGLSCLRGRHEYIVRWCANPCGVLGWWGYADFTRDGAGATPQGSLVVTTGTS